MPQECSHIRRRGRGRYPKAQSRLARFPEQAFDTRAHDNLARGNRARVDICLGGMQGRDILVHIHRCFELGQMAVKEIADTLFATSDGQQPGVHFLRPVPFQSRLLESRIKGFPVNFLGFCQCSVNIEQQGSQPRHSLPAHF